MLLGVEVNWNLESISGVWRLMGTGHSSVTVNSKRKGKAYFG